MKSSCQGGLGALVATPVIDSLRLGSWLGKIVNKKVVDFFMSIFLLTIYKAFDYKQPITFSKNQPILIFKE